MILTGNEIIKQVKKGKIIIKPFTKDQINPNSYNYRIGKELICFYFKNDIKKSKKIKIPEKGFILEPHKIYLANTYETLGSSKYAMSLIGRSSLGRLGLFLQVSANLGHTGSVHKWTLEIVSTTHFKIYPNMIIGQISFWTNKGNIKHYNEGYSLFNMPKLSILEEDVTNDINR